MVVVRLTEKMSPESEKQGPAYGVLRGFPMGNSHFPLLMLLPSGGRVDTLSLGLLPTVCQEEGQQLDLCATTLVGGDGVVVSKGKSREHCQKMETEHWVDKASRCFGYHQVLHKFY